MGDSVENFPEVRVDEIYSPPLIYKLVNLLRKIIRAVKCETSALLIHAGYS